MSSVKKQLLSGITYTAISKYFGMAISILVTAILARLISPSDFGIVAIATVIIAFFGMFSELGIAPAIIQNKELTEPDLSNIFSFTLWVGIIISGCFFFLSPFVAEYYDSPVLTTICRILAVSLLFNALNIVPNAILMKKKEFKFVAFRTLAIQIVGGIFSVTAALKGGGVYALLINPVFTSVMVFIVSYKKYPQAVKITFGIKSIRKIFTFSIYQFLFNIINFFSRNLDKLLIGKYMGMDSLGYYGKSYRLMMLPLENITHVVTPVMHPVLSEFQNDLKHLSWSYLRVVKLLAYIGIPLSVFLFFSSGDIILLIYGGQWERAIPVFRILSLIVWVQMVLSTSGSIFQAANDTKSLFISGLLSAILNVSGILAGIFIFKTLEAVAWCICISFFMNFIQCYFLMYFFTFKLSIGPFVKEFISPLILGAILAVIYWLLLPFFVHINILISFILKGFILALICFFYIQYTHVYDLLSFILRIKKEFMHLIKNNNFLKKE